jgi:hypothetical protein
LNCSLCLFAALCPALEWSGQNGGFIFRWENRISFSSFASRCGWDGDSVTRFLRIFSFRTSFILIIMPKSNLLIERLHFFIKKSFWGFAFQ